MSQPRTPHPRQAVLLINLGSPASTEIGDVRRYLNEFLMDPYVLDAPWLVRRLILSAFILPFRPRRTQAAYRKIWLTAPPGSPLLKFSTLLLAALRERVEVPVHLAMRYGEPSIAGALAEISDDVDELIVIPLYPQHADSTTTTSFEAVRRQTRLPITAVAPFYNQPGYLDAQAAVIRDHLPRDVDCLLFSYHGLPERHVTRADPTGAHCLQSPDCCEVASPAHATCYRHQAFATSHALAGRLGLEPGQYQVSFQSRLGRLPWLRPYTDEVLAELPARGKTRLAVACPAFVADNLETLEEIGMQGRETFLAAGGNSFTLIPCLNDDPRWVAALGDLIVRYQTDSASARTAS